MGKKKKAAWAFFDVKDHGAFCKYCGQSYKHGNINKMEKYISFYKFY